MSCRYFVPLLVLAACASPGPVPLPEDDSLQPVIAELDRVIAHELQAKGLPSLSISLVEGDRIVWSKAFGNAGRTSAAPATRETIYRVGSISKLFTAVAVMQLVEQGRLDLDRPVAEYLPGWNGPDTTLRQILCHRSGMVREPPVGSYFDETEPGLAPCAKSLFGTRTVYTPGSRTKYSNGAVSLAGHVVSEVVGRSFEEHVARHVLRPLGMGSSSWHREDAGERLAAARMWSYDGREFDAPVFELGTVPAGNLYATMDDLARFAMALIARGGGVRGRILRSETLESMWEPQVTRGRYGVGFRLSTFDGQRAVGHGGAVYGFATQLKVLPDPGVGVAVSASMDVANATVSRIADHALRCLLAVRSGKALKPLVLTRPPSSVSLSLLVGSWTGVEGRYEITARGDRAYLRLGDVLAELREDDTGFTVDDRHVFGPRVEFGGDTLRVGNRVVHRSPRKRPPPVSAALRPFQGEYGWDHNVLFVHEREGRLHALVEWIFDYPLSATSDPDTWAFPNRGLYHGEHIRFRRDDAGAVSEAEVAGVRFPLRAADGGAEEAFRIEPVKPVAALRRDALAAQPPTEEGRTGIPDLVELRTLDPSIRYDIRYAGSNNFMGVPFYESEHAFMQRPAAEAVVRVHRNLKKRGYGLVIFDAYRPWAVTKMFWDATPASMKDFVADPSQGSRHNRGCAVDVTLYDLATGRPIEMVSGYDEFTERAYPWYQGGTTLRRWHRDLLRSAMEAEGFSVYEYEWWHFDYELWRKYPIMAETFEQMQSRQKK